MKNLKPGFYNVEFKLIGFQTLLRLGYRSENFIQSSRYITGGRANYNLHASDLALLQPLNQSNSIYIRRAKSFSVPNTDWVGNSGWAATNPALLPQTSFDQEVGWKFNNLAGTKLDLRYYVSDTTNEISYDPINTINFNLPQTQRRGVNLSGELIPLRNLTIGSTIDLRNATITAGTYNGKTAPLNPNTFSIRAKYNFTYNQSLSTQWNYVSRQVTSADYSNINRIPSYDTLDIRYAFKYSKRADFSVGIKNLMDKNYYSYSVIDWSSTAYYYPDPRRIFIRYPGMTAQETRWQLVGFDGNGILTVRFTLRRGWVRVIGAGYWRKPKHIYEKENQLHG